jgi:hypothetical protein
MMLASIAEREQTRTLLRAKVQQFPETSFFLKRISVIAHN